MTIEEQRKKLLQELEADWHLMAASRQLGDWDSLQACAEKVMNTARRLELLEIQSEQEAA